jgi:very-short-patch-repair endonuclease
MLSTVNFIDLSGKNKGSIQTIKCNDEIWFSSIDLGNVLGYKDICRAIKKNVKSENKTKYRKIKPKKQKVVEINEFNKAYAHTTFINKEGLTTLLLNTKLPNVDKIAEQFGINTLYRYKRKEIEIIDELSLFFNEMEIKYETQYFVDNYKIDLYVPLYKLAVEIDENGHNDRNKDDENIRQNYIENKLSCEFIRINPDEKNFSITLLIALIMKYIRKMEKIITLENNMHTNSLQQNEYNFMEIEKFRIEKQLQFELDKYKLDKQYNLLNTVNNIEKNEIPFDTFDVNKLIIKNTVDSIEGEKSVSNTIKSRTDKQIYRDKCFCGSFKSFETGICKQCDRSSSYEKLIENGKYIGTRPTKEQLKIDIEVNKLPLSWIGKKYGVCGSSVKKWIIKFKNDNVIDSTHN